MEPSNNTQHIAGNQIGPTSQILSHEINETSNWLTLTIPIDWQPKCTHFKSILTSSLNTSLNNPYHFGVCIKDLFSLHENKRETSLFDFKLPAFWCSFNSSHCCIIYKCSINSNKRTRNAFNLWNWYTNK